MFHKYESAIYNYYTLFTVPFTFSFSFNGFDIAMQKTFVTLYWVLWIIENINMNRKFSLTFHTFQRPFLFNFVCSLSVCLGANIVIHFDPLPWNQFSLNVTYDCIVHDNIIVISRLRDRFHSVLVLKDLILQCKKKFFTRYRVLWIININMNRKLTLTFHTFSEAIFHYTFWFNLLCWLYEMLHTDELFMIMWYLTIFRSVFHQG